ncbi:MAG: hypothetical protein HY690_12335 [Chloroflexi bacterium]|nr:hypothetical protein [Chloroflexota bacterium]
MTAAHSATSLEAGAHQAWQGRAVGAGVLGSVVASLCCLPSAVAIALGLSLGTAAALSQLLAYQRLFQLAGVAVALFAAWWLSHRRRTTCTVSASERDRVSLYVLGAFTTGFALLNLVVIPLLEQLPWLLAHWTQTIPRGM